MSGARKWTFLAIGVSALGLGLSCRQDGMGGGEPSASEREGRSEVLRGLMAPKEQVPDPEALTKESERAPSVVTPGPPGQGGSGLPEPTGRVQGRVSWVGDNELLIRDAAGQERDLEVNTGTRLLVNGAPVNLREVEEGDEVRVSYDEGPGGWVARQVEVLPTAEPDAGEQGRPSTPLR
ncbi:hypothetical protein [Pyxidicoccus fallax]|uniref:Lipoprotein n=1 Tax=Pyxidicoccus fallax TaxID=394095 RepID=A0A848LPS5_9BACT|nr:hypothetical protein [Pyxidicoccus fallax]NMO19583.1 hypothetical protein [Pyxidicoccus fallax]